MTEPGERWSTLRRVFRLPASAGRARRDIGTELRFHLEGRIEELIASGLTRAEAEGQARAAFGDIERYRRETLEIDERMLGERRRMHHLEAMKREGRLAIRTLTRSGPFAAIAIITLALGIGAATAVFSLLNAIVLRPLPYANADRLVSVEHTVPGIQPDAHWGISVAGYFELRRSNRSLEEIGVVSPSVVNVMADEGAMRVGTAYATASLLRVLGITPVAGRLFVEDENGPAVATVAILGYDFWQRQYGGDRSIVGRRITVNAQEREVVGVLAPGADLPLRHVDLWLPLTLDASRPPVNMHFLELVGRVRPGVELDAVRSDMTRVLAQFPERFPSVYTPSFMRETRFGIEVRPLRELVIGNVSRVLWILFGAVGLVLLIACANVANLFVVRLAGRRREISIRQALGAERAHLAWNFLSESMLLAIIAGVGAVLLATWAMQALVSLAPAGLPRLSEVRVRWTDVAFALGVSLLVGLVFGLAPALRTGSGAPLREGGRGNTTSRGERRIRNGLVVAQVALALVLLSGAGLMLRSFQHLRAVRPGFDPNGVLAFEVNIPRARYLSDEATNLFHRELTTRLAALPGVDRVGGGTDIPLDGFYGCAVVFVEGKPVPPGTEPPCLETIAVLPGYFRTLGIPVRGVVPTWDDVMAKTAGVVVTRALAQRLWPGEDPIGKGIRGNGDQPPYYRVVGIVEDLRGRGLDAPSAEAAFFPTMPMAGAQLWGPYRNLEMVVHVRSGSPTDLVPVIRRLLTELDPTVPLANPRTMVSVVERSVGRTSFTLMLLAIAAGMSLLLSAVGVYGVISYIVGLRRTEIGIRIALGAQVAQVRGMIVRQSLALAGAGVVIGIAAALFANRLLTSLLFGVSPTDPATMAVVAGVLVVVALIAAFAPAHRATRIDPVQALRTE